MRTGTVRTCLVASLALAALAEPILAQRTVSRTPSSRAMEIRAEMASVLLQSGRYAEAAREYALLLQLDPHNRAYRLGLARALAWGERFRDAERELLRLARQRPGDPTVESLLASVRAGMEPTSREAADWLAQRPGSPAYRRILARAFTRERRTGEALAHYDTLLFARPQPELLVERAQVHVARQDFAAAERDVAAAINAGGGTETFLLMGDLHRWRGDYARARNWYVRARVRSPDSDEVLAAFARLARDERPAIAFLPDVFDAPGWTTAHTVTSDNLGASLVTSALRRGLRPRGGFDASVGLRMLRLADRPALGSPQAGNGFGGDVAISRETSHRQYYARARARGGLVVHPSSGTLPDASVAVVAYMDAWGLGGELSTSPAYPQLLTFTSWTPDAVTGEQLRETSSTISLAGPLARADVAASYQTTTLSDENARATLRGYARYPLRKYWGLLYAGSAQSFERASVRYWSPERYVAHAAGIEFAARRVRGVSFAARVLPGLAWTTERAAGSRSAVTVSAPQLSAGVEATYRARGFELGAALSYGRGRAGDYQRFDALLQGRYAP